MSEPHAECYESNECVLGCDDQECGYANGEPVCPNCGAGNEYFDLVCGDHGNECTKCRALFCCP